VTEYVGGYEDWLRQRPAAEPVRGRGSSDASKSARGGGSSDPTKVVRGSGSSDPPVPPPSPRKASYREQQELLALPGRIETLESEQQRLNAAVASPDFYKEPAETIAATLARLAAIEQELLDALARWDELDSLTKR
jgi:ATP-binding cassette subfamily F protein uup